MYSFLGLIASGLLICGTAAPLFGAPVPSRANIAKVYNITPARNQAIDVRYFRKDECSKDEWCKINGTGEYLKADDWLLTGQVSRADLALMYNQTEYRKVLFWQEEGSRSRFKPQEGSCHFTTDIGKFLYAHPHTSADPGCEKITSTHALIIPNGTVLFVVGDENDTRVGVLSSGSKNPVVQNRKSGKRVTLKEGEFGEYFADGRIEKGEFSLADFYDKNTLGLGLGPADEDIAYVNEQEPEIQEILKEIRKETLEALYSQSIPTGPIDPPSPIDDPDPPEHERPGEFDYTPTQ